MAVVVVDAEDTSSASELVIDGAKIDRLDAILAKEGCAHDAWLNSDIQGALVDVLFTNVIFLGQLLTIREQVALAAIFVAFVRTTPIGAGVHGRIVGHKGRGNRSNHVRKGGERAHSHELSMASAVASHISCVHAFGDDFAVANDHAADRGLVGA